MLAGNLSKGAMKGTGSREPFVDHHGKRILITGRTGLAPKLFWGHVACRACDVLHTLRARGLGDQSNAEVAEQDLLASPNEQVLWFNIAMDEVLVVSVLEGISDLLDIAQDRGQGEH